MSRTKEISEELRKELMLLIRLEEVTKTISKEFGLHETTVRLSTNGGNSVPLLPSPLLVDQQRSLQSRTCNSLRGW